MKIKQTVAALLVMITGFSALIIAQPAFAAESDLKCSVLPQDICNSANEGDLEKSGTWKILLLVLNILTACIGIVAVGALGFAGFLYATAADDQSKVKQAKDVIRNVAIGIVAYGLMYVALQFLIPGGVFQ